MAASDTSGESTIYLTITTPLAADLFEVMGISGEEHISGLFEYQIELSSHDIDIDMEELLGQPVTINIAHEDGTTQHRNGIVVRLTQRTGSDEAIIYQAEVRPWFWMLTRTSDCRIFQHQSVPEIIETTFGDLGYTEFKISLGGSYPSREFCVQYNETHFDFVSRLMEDEGIFYFFEHTDSGHKLIIADDTDAHDLCPGLSDPLRYRKVEASWADQNTVNACSLQEQIVLNKYVMTDYYFETPATDLSVNVDGQAWQGDRPLEMLEYPGGYRTKGDGERRAQTRIETMELAKVTVMGESNCMDLIAGYRFTLAEHDRSELNQEYVLRSVTHSITPEGYRNSFLAFPSSVPFRPARVTPKPALHGYQTATVVGMAGEEIHTDKYGRVTVHFPWDRRSKKDENSSCWVRVAQISAGKGWGSMYIPRIGAEVLVSFLDGDPDRPLIIGSVYNGQQTPPNSLPDDKVKSSIKTNSSKGGGGSNEITLDDTKGKEAFFMHAQYDYTMKVEHDVAIDVLGKHTETIDGDTSITVKAGKYSHDVQGGTATLHVSGVVTESFDADMGTTVGGKIDLTSGKAITITADTEISLIVGASTLVMKKDGTIEITGVNLKLDGTKVVTTGSAEASMTVGSQGMKCTPAEAAVSGAMVKSSAMGVNEITGAVIKLN